MMKPNEILNYYLNNLENTIIVESFQEKCLFFNPNNKLKRGIYILTIKEKDSNNDKASNLNRENIFRVNIGIRKSTFIKIFNEIPKRPKKGNIINMQYDFTLLDTLLPHPIYGWMAWICILNPSIKSFDKLDKLIKESYEYAKEKFIKKL